MQHLVRRLAQNEEVKAGQQFGPLIFGHAAWLTPQQTLEHKVCATTQSILEAFRICESFAAAPITTAVVRPHSSFPPLTVEKVAE
jgi:hypothetical protein